MRAVRLLSAVAASVAVLGLTVPAAASAGAAPAAPDGLSAATVAQIDALSAAKNARTPAERKVSSQLLTAVAQRNGGRVAAGVGPQTTTAVVAKNGTTRVSITAVPNGDVSAIAKLVDRAGGSIRGTWKTSVDADVPLGAITSLAASDQVRRIDPAERATLAGVTPTPGKSSVQQRVAATAASAPKTGSVEDQGDVALAADVARSTYKVGGSGITVGVLSDGVDSLAASIASGDLPASTRVLDGQAGSGDEGTAMLEIVHDVAPTANLLFATAFESESSFADNIRALRSRRCRRHRRRRHLLRRVRRSRTAPSRRPSPTSPPTAPRTSVRPATRATSPTAPPATGRACSPPAVRASASSRVWRTTSPRVTGYRRRTR